ncbi:MAG: Hpt domain-containing protein, partial [Acidobacteriota bacterium]
MQGGFQELLDEFLLEARERADEVETLLLRLPQADDETRRSALAQTKRELHTLKGNSGMMGFSDLQQIAHLMEDQVEAMDLDAPAIDEILQQLDHLRHGLEAIRSPAEESEDAPLAEPTGPTDSGDGERFVAKDIGGSVRVPFAKIDHLVDMQAETLIFRNRLADAVAKGLDQAKLMEGLDGDQRKQLVESWEEVSYARQAMEKTLGLLQEEVTELGMVPLQSLFRSLGRIVHDESNRSGKQVDFEVRGGDTPIDKTLIEAAGDALGHLVRNAVIHGVETPEDRRLAGKPERGTVAVSATLETGEVRIDVSDDGG